MLYWILVGTLTCSAAAQDTPEPPLTGKPWLDMDYGPFLTATIEAPRPEGNFAYKGVMVDLDVPGGAYMVFDTDLLRWSAGWTGERLNLNNVAFDGQHWKWPTVAGRQAFGNPIQPGWAGADGFADPRPLPYGPLPRDWAHYSGLYLHGEQVVFCYTVRRTNVRELGGAEPLGDEIVFTRTFEIEPNDRELTFQVASDEPLRAAALSRDSLAAADEHAAIDGTLAVLRSDASPDVTAVGCVGENARLHWDFSAPDAVRVRVAPSDEPLRFKLCIWSGNADRLRKFADHVGASNAPGALQPLLEGGPPRWPQTLVTHARLGGDDAAYVIDEIPAPEDNPWHSWMRFGGFDYFADPSRAAICTWNGDVWLVGGLGGDLANVTWQRIATGLFQPLGLKIVDEQIYVLGRDQITILHDLNGDGEADYYENFNNDHQVTDHFHEFAMDLQRDAAGDFYYMKAARHALDSVVPQHGTLLKVAHDGSSTEIICNGFRAPNGLGIGPGGELISSDQEGHWMPANRINVLEPGGFYGNMYSYHRGPRPTDYDPPLCWLPKNVDRSPAEQLWVTSDRWGPLEGGLIGTSYGTGQMYRIMFEQVDGVYQGGVVFFPLDFPTGIMRGRFNPNDGQLYLCGLFGWSSNKTTRGGFYRVRYTGRNVYMPNELHATDRGMVIGFTEPLDRESAQDVDNYAVEQWTYRWTANYGSPHYRVSDPQAEGQDPVPVRSATLLDDGRSVFLEIEGIAPVMQMQIRMALKAADGTPMRHVIHSTINRLAPSNIDPARLARNTRRESPANDLPQDRRAQGLAVTFTGEAANGSERIDRRTSRLAALYVPAASPPTPFLEPGPFQARFDGFLEVDLNGDYRFDALGEGNVMLRVNGATVLELSERTAGGRSEYAAADVALRKGLNAIEIRYESPPRGDASLRLLWASDEFAPEPIPPEVLVHDSGDAELASASTLRDGRQLFAERRCLGCHEPPPGLEADALAMPELAATGPSLAEAAGRLNADWTARWILDPPSMRNDVTMPHALVATPDDRSVAQQALDLAAYLASLEVASEGSASATATDAATIRRGEAAFEQLGCIGCHTFVPPHETDKFNRVSLYYAGLKYRSGALAAFLRAPHRLYPWSRMPEFKLDADEAASLAAFVRSKGARELPPLVDEHASESAGRPDRGRELFVERGCRGCHEVPGVQEIARRPIAAWSSSAALKGCLASTDSARQSAPDFRLSDEEVDRLQAFLASGGGSLARHVPEEFAARQVERLRCTVCHGRDGRYPPLGFILEEEGVLGLPPTPLPTLTWTGEKLHTDWMRDLLAGDVANRSRTWLAGRMPSFGVRADELAAGLAAEHGLGPEESLGGRRGENESGEEPPPKFNAAMAEVGRRLIEKEGGFNCIQCHAVGDRPAAAPFETPGINLRQAAERLRYPYYVRWMRDPLRIDPTTKMQRLSTDGKKTALTDVYQGDARRQFDALWHYMQSVRAE